MSTRNEIGLQTSSHPLLVNWRLCGICLFICIGLWSTAGSAKSTVSDSEAVLRLIWQAGNAATDEERLNLLLQLAKRTDLSPALKADVSRLVHEIEEWIHNPDLPYFWRKIRLSGTYDFGIAEKSPLFPIVQFYHARMIVWVVLESGDIWGNPNRRRTMLDNARALFEDAAAAFPENPVIRMYLGEPIPPRRHYPAVPGAPEWAVYQREALERLTDIITWWIDHRMQESGAFGGGWGDDCEMWRWWTPVLIGFHDPKITAAQARFSRAMFEQKHMKDGYTSHLYDVEHTAEDSADTLTPMMHLEPDNPEWSARVLRLADLMETLWTGVNERGMLQFKSTYFNATRVDDSPRRACDTPMHVRAMQPTLLYWQRTGDARLTRLFRAWMDTWVDAAARAERGKPAGVLPSAIHWPDGRIGGLGEKWWDPENHTEDPLYVWPSALNQMAYALLLTHHMTGEDKYLEPIRVLAALRLRYLTENPPGPLEEGSEMWCGSKLGRITGVIAKYRYLTGDRTFDDLLRGEASPYAAFCYYGEGGALSLALRNTAEALRLNFEGYTSEVRYTDRVLRFPSLFGQNGMYPEPVVSIRVPDPALLYSTVTGDMGDALYFPLNAVRWLTPPRDIAALVTDCSNETFEARLFHFGTTPRQVDAELYLLKPGSYELTLRESASPTTVLTSSMFEVSGLRCRVSFELPPRRLCVMRVSRVSH
ncbi:MAG TPA: hypothetical protein PKY35_04525 [Candidatus Hydrogenedentes bacterium]|nr:hypothetical protein [Candidatus Hydrogenedentota bacterium]HOL76273.1 hypothetical protein [Candidatus Hydrogenedentota bacterium]